MQGLIHDLRYGVRLLLGSPGFTVAAVVILGLGIGATTSVFSIANAAQLRLLNDSTPGGLVQLFSRDRTEPDRYRPFSYPNYRDIRDSREVFSGLLAQEYALVGLADGSLTRRVMAILVSSNYFSTLGVNISRGRPFTSAEEEPGAPPVVIVSHLYWVTTGSDPSLIGKTVQINARSFTVVGIAPEKFTGTMALGAPLLWLPLGVADSIASFAGRPGALTGDRSNHRLMPVGRLKPGLTPEAATSALGALGRRLEHAYPAENQNQVLSVHLLQRIGASTAPRATDLIATAMTFLLGMAMVVLLVASLNLANMLLARGGLRQREVAVRLAVGGSRWRIVRQLLAEAFVLSLAGGAVGLLLAYQTNELLVSTLVGSLPVSIVFDPTPDARVIAATVLFCGFSTLVFGLGPALRLSRPAVIPALKEQAGDLYAGHGRRRRFAVRHALVVAQVALSLGLLAAGGLFLSSAWKATAGDPGYSLDGELVVSIDPALAGYDEPRARGAYARVLDRVRTLAGVASASFASTIPYGEISDSRSVQREGASRRDPVTTAQYAAVGSDYFRTFGISLLRGREFTAAEETTPSPLRPVIVDTALAERLWPGRDPIGQRLQLQARRDSGPVPDVHEVVGVAANVRSTLFAPAGSPHVYVPYGGHYIAAMTVHVGLRSTDQATSTKMLRTIEREIRATEPSLPIIALKTFRDHRNTSFEFWYARAAANVFTAFGLAALLVAGVGVYGLRAFMVARRTREIGIRMALGASAADVLRLVVFEGVRLVVIGLGIGLVLALGICSLLSGWVYGVSAVEPAVLVGAPVVLAAALLLACFVPARRAASIAPTSALRCE